MRKMDIVQEFDEEGYSVMTRDDSCHKPPLVEECLPITMQVLGCKTHKLKSASILELISFRHPDLDICDDFRQHYLDIVAENYNSWILVEFQIKGAGLVLVYRNTATEAEEYLDMNLFQNGAHIVNLEFRVLHTDGRPDTVYHLDMQTSKPEDREQYCSIGVSERTATSLSVFAFHASGNDCDMEFTPQHAEGTVYVDF